MTDATWAMVAGVVVIALVDWFAVRTENRQLEYAAKPATMVALIGVALELHPVDSSMRTWFVIALVCSLAGDVLLMLPNEELFVAGLGSFLVGHVAYIVGLISGGVSTGAVVVGAIITLVLLGSFAPTIIKGAKEKDARLAVPVFIYVLTISVMVTLAIGSTVPIAIAGAALFYASDFTIGWSKFVADFAQSRMVIITTYHLAQLLLVLSLTRAR